MDTSVVVEGSIPKRYYEVNTKNELVFYRRVWRIMAMSNELAASLLAFLVLYFLRNLYAHFRHNAEDEHDVGLRPTHKSRAKADAAHISGQEITIDYIDSKGRETERPIRVLDIGETKAGNTTILAFCFFEGKCKNVPR